MHYAEAQRRLTELLSDAGFTADSLEPWAAWKVFKTFAREFSAGTAERAEPANHLVSDLTFDAAALPAPDAEFRTHDAPAFAAFVDRVESDPGFQTHMNARPVASSVYYEENRG